VIVNWQELFIILLAMFISAEILSGGFKASLLQYTLDRNLKKKNFFCRIECHGLKK